nr:helix-turn-helix domain-containing protein [uncultured Halomonas sp.]
MKNPMSADDREALLLDLLAKLFRDDITPGSLLRQLRKQVLGMNQTEYASLVGVSRRTLSDIETDKGRQSLALLDQAFRPFGLKIGLLPRSAYLRSQLMNS